MVKEIEEKKMDRNSEAYKLNKELRKRIQGLGLTDKSVAKSKEVIFYKEFEYEEEMVNVTNNISIILTNDNVLRVAFEVNLIEITAETSQNVKFKMYTDIINIYTGKISSIEFFDTLTENLGLTVKEDSEELPKVLTFKGYLDLIGKYSGEADQIPKKEFIYDITGIRNYGCTDKEPCTIMGKGVCCFDCEKKDKCTSKCDEIECNDITNAFDCNYYDDIGETSEELKAPSECVSGIPKGFNDRFDSVLKNVKI